MTKKRTIHLLAIIAMITIVCFGYASADDLTTTGDNVGLMALSIHFWLSILSRIWIIFAKIAGELLTNARIYGSGIGLDSYLRLCWNMVKNIANFVLWFIFLFYVFKVMFFKEEATAMIKNIVVKILVAGIGIQASRFLVAATLDISTIMTAAVGAFPAQITATNIDLAEEFKNDKFIGRIRGDSDEIKEKLKLDLFPKGDIKDEEAQQQKTTVEEIPMSATISTGNIIDMLMPNANSFAGPLVYLWVSILDVTTVSTLDLTQPISAIIKILLEAGSIILYALAMILLCVIAFIRIFYLWIFIILSPIIILFYCLSSIGKEKIKEIEGIAKALKDKGFDISGFIHLAFKPVLVSLGLSLALIFLVLMNGLIKKHQEILEQSWTRVESTEERNDNATGEKGKTYQTTMDTSTLSVIINGTNKTLQSILLSIITLVFMRFIIKIAIASKTGIGILDKFTEKSTGAIRDFAGQIPIIPIGNGGAVGIDYIRDGRKDDGGDKSIINRAVNKNGIAEERKQKNDDAISKLFGQKNSNLYTEDYTRLAALSNQADNKFIQETMKHSTNGKNIGLIDDTRTNSFIVRLDKNNGKLKEYGFSDELFTGNDEEWLQKFLEKSNNLQAYRKLFTGSENNYPKTYARAKQRKNFSDTSGS